MTDRINTDDDSEEQRVQDILEDAMPPILEGRDEPLNDDTEFEMTRDEQSQLMDLFHGLVETLYDRGYTPNEVGVITSSVDHWTNARRYDPYEYDRIALSLELRRTIEEWRDDQPEEIPAVEIAEVVEEMGRMYRTTARRELWDDEYEPDGGDDDE